jgi:DNA-binding HxlR family transcriptional regulator
MQNQRDIIYEILESLPKDGTPIRFKDLRKKVKMSSSTLTKGLLDLKEIGVVDKRQVPSIRAKGVEYSISPEFGLIDLYRNIEDKCKNLDRITCIADKLILELFEHYDNAEENQKETIFNAYLSIIVRFLKLCRSLRNQNINKNCV